MSRTNDPSEGGASRPGGNADPSEEARAGGASAEHRQDEGRGEGGGRREGGAKPGDEPKTASKGINPVQHSE
jgi:hypothetical protein